MKTFVLHCKQYYKCLRLSDLSRNGTLHYRISCYRWSSGVCVCVCLCLSVRMRVCVCVCTGVSGIPVWVYHCNNPWLLGLMLETAQQLTAAETCENILDLKIFSPRNFCIWFILLKRLPYFIQYLYSTSHCATAKDTWSFSYNIVRLCSSKFQYFYRQWLLHWICSKWD